MRDHHLHHRHRGAPYQQFFGHAARVKRSPRPVPELRSCAFPGRAWRFWATTPRRRGRAPVIAEPLPRVLELTASKVADSTALAPSGHLDCALVWSGAARALSRRHAPAAKQQ